MRFKLIISAFVIAGAALQVLPGLADDSKPMSLPRTAAPAGVELYIISPKDGDIVGKEVTVRFGLRGMGVSPAGAIKEGTGHHHLLIDTELPPNVFKYRECRLNTSIRSWRVITAAIGCPLPMGFPTVTMSGTMP